MTMTDRVEVFNILFSLFKDTLDSEAFSSERFPFPSLLAC